ncbi:MAG: hypothetical protein ACP5NV_06105 [Candidatus Woesearchaeota archaeon]
MRMNSPKETSKQTIERVFETEKPILAGVYTQNRSAEEMVFEVLELSKKGIHGIYLENNDWQNDLKNPELSIVDKIIPALDILKNMSINAKLGINIMPDYFGIEYVTAFNLAKTYDLQFVMLDLIAGKHKITRNPQELGNGEYSQDKIIELFAKGYNQEREKNPGILTFGGVISPYATPVRSDDETDEYILNIARKRCDVLMAKTMPGENNIPLSRINQYSKNGTIVFAASYVNEKNMAKYFPAVNGFIIGSALRNKDSSLNNSNIDTIMDLRAKLIKENDDDLLF